MKRKFGRALAIALVCALLAGGISTAALAKETPGLSVKTFGTYLQEVFDQMSELGLPEIDMALEWSKSADGRTQVSADSEDQSLLACSFLDSDVMEYGWCGGPVTGESVLEAELQACCLTSLVANDQVLERIEILSEIQSENIAEQETKFTENGDGYVFYDVGAYTAYLFYPEDDTVWAFWRHQDAAWTVEELYAKSQEVPAPLAAPEKRENAIVSGFEKALGTLNITRGVSLDSFEAYLRENVKEFCKADDIPYEDVAFVREETPDGRAQTRASIGSCDLGGVTFLGSNIAECLWIQFPVAEATEMDETYFAGYVYSGINNPIHLERLNMVGSFFDEAEKTRGEDEEGFPLFYVPVEAYTVYLVMPDKGPMLAFHLHEDSAMTYEEAKAFVKARLEEPISETTAKETTIEEDTLQTEDQGITLSDFEAYYIEGVEAEAKAKGMEIGKLAFTRMEEEGFAGSYLLTDDITLFAVAFSDDPVISFAAIRLPKGLEDNRMVYMEQFVVAVMNDKDAVTRRRLANRVIKQMSDNIEEDSEGDLCAMGSAGVYRIYAYSLDSERMLLCIHENSGAEPVGLKNLALEVD